MELFNSALQGKAMVMYEYFLVGSVSDRHKDGFLEILRGLCDNPENRPIEFLETEWAYSGINSNGVKLMLKARSSRNQPDGNCHLRYVGQSDLKIEKQKTMVRFYIDCLASANLNDYMNTIGFNLENELAIKGYLFHKGRLKIVVSKFYTLIGGNNQAVTDSHFVEVSCVVPAGQESVADDVRRFADLLKPYVKMEKLHTIKEELNIG